MRSPRVSDREPADHTPRAHTAGPRLSADQVAEVLALLRRADGVELKVSVPDIDRRSVVAAFGMDPLDAQIRQVAFFDTVDLALDRHGLVVRVRRVQGKAGDAVIKLRPVEPERLSQSLRAMNGFGVEVDALPGGFVCSASMKATVEAEAAKDLLGGGGSLPGVLSQEQHDFYAAFAPSGIELADLRLLGPITVFKLKFRPRDFDRRLVAELWLYPDGSRILELSTKAKPAEALDVAEATRAMLAANGVDLSAAQQTKTKNALEFFVREFTAPVETAR
jgi:hypothetical protein